jgi:polar amino acid transport system substrate-binding protein
MNQLMANRRTFLSGITAAAAALALPASIRAAPLEKVKDLGVLRVGLYADNRPWSWDADGKVAGIDADIARVLATALGVRADIQLVSAGEDISDDLRNIVWRGGLLGFQPCDVMLHVPFERALMQREDNCIFLSPYYRESFGAACSRDGGNCEAVPASFKGRPVAAELASIPDFYLLGHAGGILAKDLIHLPNGYAAAATLADGSAEFSVATAAQIEAVVADHPDAGIKVRKGPLPMMMSPGWDIGMALKENSRNLGFALDEIIEKMLASGQMKDLFARHGVAWRPALSAQT